MSAHEKFQFASLEALESKIQALHVNIRLSKDLAVLSTPQRVGVKTAPNRFAVLPMEGCDSARDGSPTDLVFRRYERFAAGGAGLLWWEANAVVEEGRANELQMMLTRDNLGQFVDLVKRANASAENANGSENRPLHILQLTHRGRYSRPAGHKAAPIVPQRDPILDARSGVTSDACICTDDYLDDLVAKYVQSALLAQEAGFDGVDIKACHRYLISELLASHTRPGKYGGSFENRIRFLRTVVEEVRRAAGNDFIVACRFNVFDAHPYPYGFGGDTSDFWTFRPEEPMALVRMLCERGVALLSNSAGNPYYIYPQVTRPFDTSSQGIPTPQEHPLESIARLFDFTRHIQNAAGDVPVVGNGYSWLRQFLPYAGAANLLEGACRFVGLGRQSFAYPDLPRDVLRGAGAQADKVCITCSKCTQIMRDHGRTGCVVRDSQIYAPLYREYRQKAEERAAHLTHS